MNSRTIALDIGEVCIDLHEAQALKYFGFGKERVKDLPPELLYWLDLYERGKAPEHEVFKHIRPLLPHPMTDVEIKTGWNLILGPEKTGIAELVREGIRMGYRFAFFSDTSPAHFLKCAAGLSFAHLVDGRITSYETGSKKPEAGMFNAFEYAFGTPAFYFDDKPCNILAAHERGWNAHRFTTPQTALKALKALKAQYLPADVSESD